MFDKDDTGNETLLLESDEAVVTFSLKSILKKDYNSCSTGELI